LQSRMSTYMFSYLTTNLFDQPSILSFANPKWNITCIIYTFNLKTFEFSMVTDVDIKVNEVLNVIKLTEDQIILRLLHPSAMEEYIKQTIEKGNRYLSLNLCFDSELKDC
jgi:hypothetical protein